MNEAFVASLFSISVAGVAVSSGLLGLVLGSWLGWNARETCAVCRMKEAA